MKIVRQIVTRDTTPGEAVNTFYLGNDLQPEKWNPANPDPSSEETVFTSATLLDLE